MNALSCSLQLPGPPAFGVPEITSHHALNVPGAARGQRRPAGLPEWCTSRSHLSKVSLAGPGSRHQRGKRWVNGPSTWCCPHSRSWGATRSSPPALQRPQGLSHPDTTSRNHVGNCGQRSALGSRRCPQLLPPATPHSNVYSARLL